MIEVNSCADLDKLDVLRSFFPDTYIYIHGVEAKGNFFCNSGKGVLKEPVLARCHSSGALGSSPLPFLWREVLRL